MHTAEVARLVAALSQHYRIGEEIGRGGWGVVYRADDLRLPRAVAIKVMLLDHADPDARERFRREIDLEARLVHPHIVPVIESGEVGDALYFVMPFVEGDALREHLATRGPLAPTAALRVARQVAEGLAYAHARGIVHRDIKPANILLAAGTAMIADFGIARALNATDAGIWTTMSGLRLGTPAYMSPEQAAGDPLLDGRSDIYSLGCVLFEMLTGHAPYATGSAASILGQHAVAPIPSVHALRPDVPAAFDDVLSRMLAKAPEDRFPDAAALIAALDSLPTQPLERGWRRDRRFPPLLIATVLVLAAAGVVGITKAAGARVAARLLNAPDTTRLVVFPLEGDVAEREAATEILRRAFARWDGLTLVDAFEVRDAVGSRPLTSRRAAAIARDRDAGRYLRGSITRTDAGLEFRAVLSATDGSALPLAEVSERLPLDTRAGRDSVAGRAVATLLFRDGLRPDVDVPALTTRNLLAVQLYLRGRAALGRWDLDSAVTTLDAAWQADQTFSDAALWLALARYWRRETATAWRLPAQVVGQEYAGRDPRYRRHAAALLAVADGDIPRACAEWDALTVVAPLEFSAWYSAALCRDRDQVIVRDARSPSGWRFRSSFHTAQLQYLRAFQQMPTIHRALRDRSYERVRVLLSLAENSLRSGRSAETGALMVAFPVIEGDTLVFVPVQPAQLAMGDPAVVRLQRSSSSRVVQQQRELFRDIANVWVSADPRSADAREAQALALQMVGDASALDTLARARALATSADQRRRLAASEVLMRVRLGVPDDRRSLRYARVLADSVLRLLPGGADDATILTVAALTGRRAQISAPLLATEAHPRDRDPAPASLLETEIAALRLDAAFGVSTSAFAARAQRVDSLIRSAMPAEAQRGARHRAFSQASALAFPTAMLPAAIVDELNDDYLVRVIGAVMRGDTAAIERGIRELLALRATWPPETVSFDALVAEVALLLHLGDLARAAQWLDAALRAQRTAAPDFDPIQGVAFVRAMRLRAEVAERQGDLATAARWRAAVDELWSDADRDVQHGAPPPGARR